MLTTPITGTVPFWTMVRRDWKNPPNIVTAIRMVGALGLPPLIMNRTRKLRLAAFILFAVLAGTDKLDGWLAKKVYHVTDLGKLLDPLVDKELIAVTLVSLLADAKRRKDHALAFIVAAAFVVIVVREVAVMRIKVKAQQRDHKVESAIQSGRVSMVMQSVALGTLLVPSDSPAVRKGKFVLLAGAVGASLYSWWDYARRYRAHPS